jgi:hypothetical protein
MPRESSAEIPIPSGVLILNDSDHMAGMAGIGGRDEGNFETLILELFEHALGGQAFLGGDINHVLCFPFI